MKVSTRGLATPDRVLLLIMALALDLFNLNR